MENQRGITAEQWRILMGPLNSTRVSQRSQAGATLSYLEAWDVKAHLTRVFGFGNWDSEMVEYHPVFERPYTGRDNKEMIEVGYSCRMRLTIRDQNGEQICVHAEAAVGSASGPLSMLGEHHDNALKTAASDALKRCAINLGTQFGLSLYNNGTRNDVIKSTLIRPEGAELPQPTAEQQARLSQSVGAQDRTPDTYTTPEGYDDSPEQGDQRH